MDKPKFETCIWNGNEIVKASEPNKGIAGIAHDTEEEWGPMFAAAPDMYEALKEIVAGEFATEFPWPLAERVRAALTRAEGRPTK